ncbi:MAG: YigZ family protein [Roseburia sp.]
MQSQKMIYRGGEGEIEEKKSRFIAHIQPVESEEEAASYINEMKKKYWDARHNCSAFVLGDNQEMTRCSDDGEPSGTAGRPMLDVLLREGLHNVVVVVTRYFGGTLLGTGGLVRAYQAAVQEGLTHCTVLEKLHGQILHVITDYNGVGKVQYLLGSEQIPILESEYGENVCLKLVVELSQKEKLEKKLTDATNGKAQLEWKDPVSYGMVDGQVQLF